MRIKVKVRGIEELKAKLGADAADDLRNAIDLDLATETRKTAVDAASETPVDTGALRASILSSPEREEKMVFYWGSKLPYALRQEYEHKVKRSWMRDASKRGARETERTLTATIKRRLGG